VRIVIVGTDTFYSSVIARRLIESGEVVGIALTTAVFPGRGPLSTAVHILRRYSVLFFGYKIVETLLFRALVVGGGAQPGIAVMGRKRRIPVMRTDALNSGGSVAWISALKPDLIVSISASQRFGRRLRNVPTLACLNIHAAPLPRYRGLAPYFWVLLSGEAETAVSVHIVDVGLDTGGIVLARAIPVQPHDTAQSLFLRCCIAGADALFEAIAAIRSGSARIVPQEGPSSYYSWPTKAAMREFKRKGRHLWSVGDFIRDVRTGGRDFDSAPHHSER
jgi:formyl transferase-like protein